MVKYLLVGCHTILPYNITDGRYVEMDNLSCLSLLLILSIKNINKKKVYKDLQSHKSHANYSTHIVKTKEPIREALENNYFKAMWNIQNDNHVKWKRT